MARKRVILELGTGNDLHGGDYTKAALRAVQDALHHSSLSMLRSLGVDSKTQMFVEVTIGVQQPDKVDTEAVKASLPHGIVTVKAVLGGLDVIDRERGDNAVIAAAAIAVRRRRATTNPTPPRPSRASAPRPIGRAMPGSTGTGARLAALQTLVPMVMVWVLPSRLM